MDKAKQARGVIYIRVSREDLHVANQRPQVESLLKSRGFELSKVYEETGSAAKQRPVFDQMLLDAQRGAFEAVAVWAIDRFGRSMRGNLNDIFDLDALGVQLLSVQESWLDMAGPTRDLLIAIMSWVAQQERARLIERTRVGLDRARAKGVKLGRPQRPVDLRYVLQLEEAGLSDRGIARRLGIAPSTLRRARLTQIGRIDGDRVVASEGPEDSSSGHL